MYMQRLGFIASSILLHTTHGKLRTGYTYKFVRSAVLGEN